MSDVQFSQLINSVSQHEGDRWHAIIPANWMQGRTTYGGLSAALCLAAAQKAIPELPPLRSALINFVGPVGGDVAIDVDTIRRGKSVVNLQANMSSEQGPATNASFVFGTSRVSKLNKVFHSPITQPNEIPRPEHSIDLFKHGPGPVFSNNFECLLAKGDFPVSGSDNNELYLWIRHKDKEASDLAALIGIADMPPPAVLPMFDVFSPISTMTWMINFVSEKVMSNEGWWLLRTSAEHSANGYSSQDMQVWNDAGELVITGRQNVAVFY